MSSSGRSMPSRRDPSKTEAWILGSGLSPLTTAVHLIQDAGLPPSRIHILEKLSMAGGGSVSYGSAVDGYDFRAGDHAQFNDVCVERLLSLVPSTTQPGRTVLDDLLVYNEENPVIETQHTRFLSHKVSSGLLREEATKTVPRLRDRLSLFALTSKTEENLGRSRIKDHFSEPFFESSYWLMLATTFGFQPWHSAIEFRRAVLRFMHEIHDLNHPRVLDRGQYNRHETIISPIAKFVVSCGVDFQFNTTVTNLAIHSTSDSSRCRISEIHTFRDGGLERIINVKADDVVFVSLGSITSGATTGTNTRPPTLEITDAEKELDENWLPWLELSTKDQRFGNAYNFCTRMFESRLESFTITLKRPDFLHRIFDITGDKPDGKVLPLVTIKDSSWLITLKIPRQPLFPDQPKEVFVLWGSALYPANRGNYVEKVMMDCSGEEIFTEILRHLELSEQEFLADSITIPCLMPRATATLLPRAVVDRPQIIPEGMDNIALIGQFVEIPGETVVAQEYTVRSAQMAVHELIGLGLPVKNGDTDFRRKY